MNEPNPPEDARGVDTRGDDLLAQLTDDFLRRHRAGEHPSVEEYTSKHPDLAHRILELFPVARAMEQPNTTHDEAPLAERVGATIGRYKLLERIGEGGFGIVYMAEQITPVRRKVAVKVIKPGVDTKQVIARFEAERQVLAMMDHENIAKVLDAGATDSGRPYFVMELVHGVPITEYCDKNELAPRQRLELFVQVCRAVQHAHIKGIIHRDIKPTNVLVTLHEGVAVPKVIDFGVAKATGQQLTEKTLFTNFAQMVGTPLYMSPEQAEMTSVDVDTRSDIYSLGVLLYELLTGTTPLDKERLRKAAFDEVRRIIREEESPRPSTRLSTLGEQLKTISARRKSNPAQLGRIVRGELDWIVMRALEKERSRRYDTANGLARDVERYLSDEAVEACPPSPGYRFRKFARRNRRALTTAAIVFAALVAGTVVSTWEAVRANRATLAVIKSEARAVENAKTAQRQRARADQYFLSARTDLDRMAERLNDPKLLQIPEIRNIRTQLLKDLLNSYQAIAKEDAVDVAAILEKSSVLRMVGDIQQMLGDRAEAERAYRDAIALREPYVAEHPEKLTSYQVLATCYANLGELMEEMNRPGEAEADYRRALILWASLVTDLGYSDIGYTKYSNGIRYLIPLEKYHTRLFDLLEYRGQTEAARAVCGQLLTPFEEAAAKSPENVELQIRLADALYWADTLMMQTGRLEEGRKLGDRALSLYGKLPGDMPPSEEMNQFACRYARKADLLESRKHFEEAETAYRKVIELKPQESSTYCLLGKMLVDQNKESKAINICKDTLVAIPSYNYMRMQLAWLLANCSDVKLRDTSQAVVLAKKAVELEPTDVRTFKVLGAAQYRMGNWKAAIDALEKSGDDAAVWFFLAMSNWQLGKLDAAREWYDQAVEYMQKNKKRLDDDAWFLREADLIRFRSETAVLLDVNNPQKRSASSLPSLATTAASGLDVSTRLELAITLDDEAKLAQATAELRETVRLNPGDFDARVKLARALNSQAWILVIDADLAKRDPHRAVKLAQEAVELSPKDLEYLNTLGMAQYRDGSWKDAISSLQKYRDLRPNDAEYWNPFFLAMAHWQLGDKDEARGWYDKGIRWMDLGGWPEDHPLVRIRRETSHLLGMPTTCTTAPTSRNSTTAQSLSHRG